MKKILITGAAGYIGSKLCTKFVEEGYQVTAVDVLKYEKNSLGHLFSKKNFFFFKLDVTKKKKFKKINFKSRLYNSFSSSCGCASL